MHIVLAVAAVLPGPQDDFPLLRGEVVDQLQRLGGAHAVVVKPAGLDQRRDLGSLRARLPVGTAPELIVVPGLEPLVQEWDFVAQGLFRNIRQGTDAQHLLPIVPLHELRFKSLLRHGESPGEHPGVEGPAPPGHVDKSAAGAHHADESFQVGVAAGRGGPLDVPQVGAALHAHTAGGPGLGGDPVQGVVPILYLVVIGDPLPVAFAAAAHVLDNHGIAPLHIAVVDLPAPLFSIGGAHQYRRDLLRAGGQVHIGGQGHPIPHGHAKGAGIGHGKELLLRPGLPPLPQEGALLKALPHQQGHHLPGRAVHSDKLPALHLLVAGEPHIPLEIVDAVFAGIPLPRRLKFPLAAKGPGILPGMFRQGEKVHFQKGLIFSRDLRGYGLPIPQTSREYIQTADTGSPWNEVQLAVQDARHI